MKVYCAECLYYRFSSVLSINFCEHPKWLIDAKAVDPGSAIHPPTTYKLWHSNREKSDQLNRNNDCKLYKKTKRWWH